MGLGGDAKRLLVRQGERIRIAMRNMSPMWLRKNTINVLPGQTVTIDVEADNPGQWLYHCHNLYHQSLGMMTTLSYVE